MRYYTQLYPLTWGDGGLVWCWKVSEMMWKYFYYFSNSHSYLTGWIFSQAGDSPEVIKTWKWNIILLNNSDLDSKLSWEIKFSASVRCTWNCLRNRNTVSNAITPIKPNNLSPGMLLVFVLEKSASSWLIINSQSAVHQSINWDFPLIDCL